MQEGWKIESRKVKIHFVSPEPAQATKPLPATTPPPAPHHVLALFRVPHTSNSLTPAFLPELLSVSSLLKRGCLAPSRLPAHVLFWESQSQPWFCICLPAKQQMVGLPVCISKSTRPKPNSPSSPTKSVLPPVFPNSVNDPTILPAAQAYNKGVFLAFFLSLPPLPPSISEIKKPVSSPAQESLLTSPGPLLPPWLTLSAFPAGTADSVS